MISASKHAYSSVAIALIVALTLTTPVAAAVSVGQTATSGTSVDGIEVPSGTTLLSPAVVETGAEPAVIHLTDGRVLMFDREATAIVEGTATDNIKVTVQSGRVAYEEDGEVTTLVANRPAALDQEGQIGEGARIGEDEEEERLCQLQDPTLDLFHQCTVVDPDDEECDWELLKVPLSEVPQYLDIDSVLACEDRNILDLNCDCEQEVAAYLWWDKGLIIGAAVAGTVAGVLIIDARDDDDERPASSVTP